MSGQEHRPLLREGSFLFHSLCRPGSGGTGNTRMGTGNPYIPIDNNPIRSAMGTEDSIHTMNPRMSA